LVFKCERGLPELAKGSTLEKGGIKSMSELERLLKENPEAKEEFDSIIEMLNLGSTEQIKMWINYAERLEDMIENKVDRIAMLEEIDRFNQYTERMHADGILPEYLTWVDRVS
jgi:hypothetical protein